MRFIIMHRTNPRWEAGATATPELVARVGQMIGEMARAKILQSGDGLRASSLGVRIRTSGGKHTIIKGPFEGGNELPAEFTILRAESIDEVVDWASRQAAALGDAEIDIRPVTEPWDIGMGTKPANLTTTRYMAVRKATPQSEAGTPPTAQQKAALTRLIDEAKQSGAHLATVTMRPSSRGRRLKKSPSGIKMTDGPFAESKELIGGYVIISVNSLEEASRWATRYLEAVETDAADVYELES